MKKNNIIRLENTSGVIDDYKVLFTFKENNQNYIVYTLGEENSEGFIKAYAGIIFENEILPIKSDNEWEMVDKLINKLDGE